MGISAGRLDRQIIFKRAGTTTKDAIGFPTDTPTTQLTVRASMTPIGGSEALKFGREVSARVAKFVTRWFSDHNEKDIIVDDDGTNWDILAIAEIGRREGLEFTAEVQR